MPQDTTPINELSIEESVSEVEEIISEIEDGEIPLHKATELRERGEKILQHLREEVELSDGEVTEVPQEQ